MSCSRPDVAKELRQALCDPTVAAAVPPARDHGLVAELTIRELTGVELVRTHDEKFGLALW
jgi:hypothetical protein